MSTTGGADQDWRDRMKLPLWHAEYGVDITSWQQVEGATLAGDGYVDVEQDNGALGTTYTVEYREIQGGATFFSESAWKIDIRIERRPGPRHLRQRAGRRGRQRLPLRRRRDPGHQHGHR